MRTRTDTLIAITPTSRSCFGLVGTVQNVAESMNEMVIVKLKDVYLTPDWEDPVRVAMLFGPVVDMNTNTLFINAKDYHGVVIDGGYTQHWSVQNMWISSCGAAVTPARIQASQMPEVRRSPLFKTLSLSIHPDTKLYKYLHKEPKEWGKIERSVTMMTSTSKISKTKSSTLKKMLCQPSTQSSGGK